MYFEEPTCFVIMSEFITAVIKAASAVVKTVIFLYSNDNKTLFSEAPVCMKIHFIM